MRGCKETHIDARSYNFYFFQAEEGRGGCEEGAMCFLFLRTLFSAQCGEVNKLSDISSTEARGKFWVWHDS